MATAKKKASDIGRSDFEQWMRRMDRNFGKIADALTEYVKITRERLDREYPPAPKEPVHGETFVREEVTSAPPESPKGRFERAFHQVTGKK